MAYIFRQVARNLMEIPRINSCLLRWNLYSVFEEKKVYFTVHAYQIEKIYVKDFNSQISMFPFIFAFYFGEDKI
jgi:hypothetical protein